MDASTAKRSLLIVSGAMAAGACGLALYRDVALMLGHGHASRARLVVFGVALAAGFCMGVMSVVAGVREKE